MSLRTLWKRTVALLAAVGLSACLAAGVSADDENSGPEAELALQPTQIVADIPTEYNIPFRLEWGGGSLLHLKGRLATMGCIANNIWFHDDDKWSVYNQYDLSRDTFFIQRFKQQYEQFVPAGTLWADCYRICEFTQTKPQQHNWRWIVIENNTHECLSFEHVKEKGFYGHITHPIHETTPCNDDFDPRVKNYVFPILPLHPDVCIVKQKNR